jgi:PAS domain S-box-containing protein
MTKTNTLTGITHTTRIILDSISDGVFTVDHNWKIMSFNRAAEQITGISAEEAIGSKCWEVFRSNMCEGECALRQTMKDGKRLLSSEGYIINSRKKRIPVMTSTSLLKDEKGTVLGGVETFRDLSLVEDLRRELDGRFQIGDMVSRSDAMLKISNILPPLAQSDSAVLIQGETGTGKELLARAIHDLSARKNKKFIGINCGAFPDNLLESELFGYKAGAFTSADKNKPGYFEAAEGGTILLDEIGETSAAFQVKLLRLLEEKEIQPLGSVKPVKSDVRIIASTNRDLAEMVSRGEFRKDLFYRINVVQLVLPPLRERMEDIPLLVDKFIEKMNALKGKYITGIEKGAMALLMKHDYPGNIRELENIIEHAFILCTAGQIMPEHIPQGLAPQALAKKSLSEKSTLDDVLVQAEIKAIESALERNGYNRVAAARELGLHKSTLFRKINKYAIELPDMDGRMSASKNS